MTQQGNLFASKPQPAHEGRYCVGYQHDGRFWSISRDHRFVTMDDAATFLVAEQYKYPSELEIKLVEDLNKS